MATSFAVSLSYTEWQLTGFEPANSGMRLPLGVLNQVRLLDISLDKCLNEALAVTHVEVNRHRGEIGYRLGVR